MYGIDRTTGGALSGIDHLQQSVEDILTTRKGTRLYRPSYGSDLPALVDLPFNAATKIDMIAATADALAKWEPRLSLSSVEISYSCDDGISEVEIEVSGENLETGTYIELESVTIS